MRKLIFFLLIFIFALTIFSEISFTQNYLILQIIGNAVDVDDGTRITNANVSAIIEENGHSGNSSVTSGTFNVTINTTLNPNLDDFTVGIVVNTSDKETGYYRLKFTSGAGVSSSQSCAYRLWETSGVAIDKVTGDEITSGRVTIIVDGTEYSNTTTFSNPVWTAYLSPCLIYGKSYLFVIRVSDDGGRRGMVSFQQVHWR